jgi:transposase
MFWYLDFWDAEPELAGENKENLNDFKKMVVELYHTGSSVSSLSSEYGVSEVTIYKWIKALTPVSEETGGLTPQDIAAIQKEHAMPPR